VIQMFTIINQLLSKGEKPEGYSAQESSTCFGLGLDLKFSLYKVVPFTNDDGAMEFV
jgi:hypothetical protein